MPVIDLKDVSKLYGFGDATTLALDEVSLTIENGEFVAIMGASGSGKTTLLNLIGLLDRPTHGQYSLGGFNVSRIRPVHQAKMRRDTIGFVFQHFNLLPRLTVLENVALPLYYKGISQTKRLKMAGNVLERVGLADREYFYPGQLSGGQIQRVAIARALVNNPSVIIADEPTGNLDSGSSRLIMELLADIHKTGSTILMVTHNPELTRFASRVVFMHDGSVLSDQGKALGTIPELVRATFYHMPTTTLKDDAAGVSALMGLIKDKKPKTKKAKKAAKKQPPRTYKAKKTKGGK